MRLLSCTRIEAPAHLLEQVDCVWELRGDWRSGNDYLLPNVGIDIAIRVEGSIEFSRDGSWQRIPDRLVIGSLDRAIALRQPGPLRVVGIRLAPGSGSLLGIKASELRNRISALPDLAPDLDASIERFTLALREQRANLADVFRILEGRPQRGAESPMLRAARGLCRGASVLGVAGRLGLSRKHLYRRFINDVGWTPSQFRRLARFSLVSRLAAAAPGARWSDLSAHAGYFDQAHLARDFQQFAGRCPTSVFSAAWYANFLPLSDLSHPYKT